MSLPTPGLETVGGWTVATLPIGGELKLAVGVGSVQGPEWGLPLPWSALVILVMGFVLALCVYALLRRKSRRSFREGPAHHAGDGCGSAIDRDAPDGEDRPRKSLGRRS
jgi:hypothetical protein